MGMNLEWKSGAVEPGELDDQVTVAMKSLPPLKVPLDELVAKFPLFPDSDPAPHSARASRRLSVGGGSGSKRLSLGVSKERRNSMAKEGSLTNSKDGARSSKSIARQSQA